MDRAFWAGRNVLVTGHTGFKGSWLSICLQHFGARVAGLALDPPTTPSMFELARVAQDLRHDIRGDIGDLHVVRSAVETVAPEIIIHMAAQSLVRPSYEDPVGTYSTNVMGTVHVLEAARRSRSVRAVLVVTSDKCYDNKEWLWGYRENEPMGGHDPYSNSKGCAELVVKAYRSSFFDESETVGPRTRVASARAGNVIGGGDWARDRLIPDLMRSIDTGQEMRVRHPGAIRPWQHVLEPLSGYLLLAQALVAGIAGAAAGWNFGPQSGDERPVGWLLERLQHYSSDPVRWRIDESRHPHEAHYLKLDISKARSELGWAPRWTLDRALLETVNWYAAARAGEDMRRFTVGQIEGYFSGT